MQPQVRNSVPQNLFDEFLSVVAERTGTDPKHDLYPRLVMSVVRAVGDAAADAYAWADPGGDHHVDPLGLRRRRGGATGTHQKEGSPWLTNTPTSSSPAPAPTG